MLKYWGVQLLASNSEKDLWTLEFPFYTRDEESPHPHYERLKEDFRNRAIKQYDDDTITVAFGRKHGWNTDRKGFEALGGVLNLEDIEEADRQDKENERLPIW